MVSPAAYAIFVKLIPGAVQYIIQKDALHASCVGPDGQEQEFKREIFATLATFIMMFLVTIPLMPAQWRGWKAHRSSKSVLSGQSDYSLKLVLYTAFPASMDVAALILSMKGTMYLSASVPVLLKATRVIFAAGLSAVMLKKRVQIFEWVGVFITCVALVPIYFESAAHARLESERLKALGVDAGDSSILVSPSEVILGLCLILSAELMWAVRFVFEERLIKKKHMVTEFLVICECFFGMLFASTVATVLHFNGTENIRDSWSMFTSSTTLQILLVLYAFLAGVSNIAGLFITKHLSSVIHSLVSGLRVVFVFIPNVVRYFIDKTNADIEKRKVNGEPLDWWSLLKILGFCLLMVGTFVYNGSIKLPFSSTCAQDTAPPVRRRTVLENGSDQRFDAVAASTN